MNAGLLTVCTLSNKMVRPNFLVHEENKIISIMKIKIVIAHGMVIAKSDLGRAELILLPPILEDSIFWKNR